MDSLKRVVKNGIIRYYTPNANLNIEPVLDLHYRLVRIIYPSGSITHYKNGAEHREDGPAMIYSNGEYWWKKHGYWTRDGGLPPVIRGDGSVKYWANGKISDSPAEDEP
jgi:hypothetical protein